MSKQILVVDDDLHIREVISFALEKAGMTVRQAEHGREAVERFRQQAVDLIVLDINMPEMDGLEVCRELRKTSDVPILFLSSRDDELDRILGLEIGGDDYVTKPFSPRELVARINTILKRTQSSGRPSTQDESTPLSSLQRGRLSISPEQHLAHWGELPVNLTATEFAILLLLARHPTRVFNRDHIMQQAYDNHAYVSDRTIDSHIRHIRQKFAEVQCSGIIDTVHGVGYKLAPC